VLSDLRLFQKIKPAKLVPHPLYDNFGTIISKTEAREHLGLPANDKIILFFGFIRKYKGLDILFEALSILNKNKQAPLNVNLLIAGEFYEDEKKYQEQIDTLGIREQLILKTGFIPDSEVKFYLCATDVVVQPYRSATQSGVSPLAYHFEKPMIVTNVGGLPALVPDGKAGLVTEPNPEAVAAAIQRFYQLGENYFIPHLRTEKQKYSWTNMVAAVFQLANEIEQ